MNQKHSIKFELRSESVIRIYVERHAIDIDVWLYSLKENGEIDDVIDRGIGIGTEEAIFALLPGDSGSPRRYEVRFQVRI